MRDVNKQGKLPGAVLGALTILSMTAPLVATPATGQDAPLPGWLQPESVITWQGQNRASAGSAISNDVCDYNGDGLGDIVAGDWMWRRTEAGRIGTAYVIPSGQDIPAGGDLDAADSGAYRFEGAFGQNMSGFTVTCAGDVNGDGFDDIAHSDFSGNQLSILFGEKEVQNRSQQYLADHGFTINGLPGGRTSNYSTGIGDLNGDSFDDIAVVTKNSGAEASGRIDIVAGAADISTVTLPADPHGHHPRVLTTILGADEQSALSNVASAGDINGDGISDIVVTGYTAVGPDHMPGTRVPGMAWVVFGEQGGLPRTIELNNLGDGGFAISGPDRGGDRLGISAAAMGDINGDGYGDLLLGADSTGATAGAGVVVLGSAETTPVLTNPDAGTRVFSADEHRGWWIEGLEAGDRTGYAVAARPATAQEDHPLIVLGAYDAGAASEGAVYLIDAHTLEEHTPAPVLADLLVTGDAVKITGSEAGQRLGRTVASIGDFNGDGSGDLAWGGDAVNAGRGVISLGLMPAPALTLPEIVSGTASGSSAFLSS